MLVCARYSAKLGLWNEQQRSEQSFVRAHANECRAMLLGIAAILQHRGDAVFIQSETAEAYVELSPRATRQADFHNEFRFLSFDLLYGRAPQMARCSATCWTTA